MLQNKIKNPEFRDAVALLDAGEVEALRGHLRAHPRLLTESATFSKATVESGTQPGQYFFEPKLLWFVAENPIRNETLPETIVAVTQTIIDAERDQAPDALQQDLDYTLELAISGCVARESGKQADLVATLIQNGANPNSAEVALAHRELDAVRLLLKHGAAMTLAMAAGLGDIDALKSLAAKASAAELQRGLASASVNGQEGASRLLIETGADAKAFNPEDFLGHCTPLHNAVNAGSVPLVKLLLEAGADPRVPDDMFDTDALGWAEHLGESAMVRMMSDAD